jgi:TM2 domain-containing membrane protein YozV
MTKRSTAIVIALFFGGWGGHKFYLGQPGKGIAYFFFAITLIPSLLAWVFIFQSLAMTDEKFEEKYFAKS